MPNQEQVEKGDITQVYVTSQDKLKIQEVRLFTTCGKQSEDEKL